MPAELIPLDDREILAIVRSEAASAAAWGDELAASRADALDYYHGRPLGDEEDGASQAVSNDVFEVVEWMMPQLVRAFCGEDDLVEFAPSVRDVRGAEIATKYIRHVVFVENDGFRLIHDALKDGLLSKIGALKASWTEKREPIDRDYNGLSDLELAQLLEGLQRPGVEVSIIGQSTTQQPDGSVTYDVRVRMMRVWGQVEINAIPPEELLISRSESVIDNSTRYIGHSTVKTRSDLVQAGIPVNVVLDLPTYTGDWYNADRVSRLDSGYADNSSAYGNTMAERVEYVEHYILLDADGDGITERRLICTSGDEILRNEVLSSLPISAWSPVRIPHTAVGLSTADSVLDIQRIQTALLRGTLNNIYNVNAGGRMFVRGDVNIDDLLDSRPGGIVRGRGDSSVTPMANEYIGDRSMQVMRMVRDVRDERSGVVKHGQGLNAASLHDSASVGDRMLDQSLERVEMICRLFGEFALKPLWKTCLDLVVRNQDGVKQIRVAGGLIDVDPLAFRENYGLRVKIGTGIMGRPQRIAALNNLIQKQAEALQAGLQIVTEAQIYQATADLTELMGLDPGRYWIDPASQQGQQIAARRAQAAQQREPNPLVEAEMVKSRARMVEAEQRNRFDRADRMLEHAEKMTELELKYMADIPGSVV